MTTTEDFIREDIVKAIDEGFDAGWREALDALLDPTPESHTAMLLAAAKIPLERENGGIEVAPFKILRAMVQAFDECNKARVAREKGDAVRVSSEEADAQAGKDK